MKHIWQITLLLSIIVSNVTLFAAQDPDKPHARTGAQAEQAEPASKRQRTEAESPSLSLASEVAMHEVPASAAVSTDEQKKEFWEAIACDNVEKVIAHLNQFPQDIQIRVEDEFSTPLMYAITKNSFESFVEILKRTTAENINVYGDGNVVKDSDEYLTDWTALMYAAKNKNSQFVTKLLGRGARLDIHDDEGNTPFNVAMRHSTLEVLKILLEHDKDDNISDYHILEDFINDLPHCYYNDNSKWYFQLKPQQKKILQLLLENGAPVNKQDEDEWTPLMLAASWGMYDVVVVLVQGGANLMLTNDEGERAIDIAKDCMEDKIDEGTKIMEEKEKAAQQERWQYISNSVFWYKKIIQFLENPLMNECRIKAQRRLAKRHQFPDVLADIVGQYLAGSDKPDQGMLNDIKHYIRSDNQQKLIEILNNRPSMLAVTDEVGDTPLSFAIKWEKPIAVETILGIFDNRVANLDGKIKELQDFSDSLRDIKENETNNDQLDAIEKQLTLKNKKLAEGAIDTIFIYRAAARGKAALIQLDTEINNKLIQKHTEDIRNFNIEKEELLKEHNTQFEHALAIARALNNQEVQSPANQEIIELLYSRLYPEVPSASLAPASASVLPLNMLPLEFIQQLKLHTKAAIENVGLHLKDHPEDLNGVDRFGNTPLMMAAEGEDEILIATLLELGANRTLRNNGGESAFDLVDQRAAPEANEARKQLLERLKNMLR